MTSKSRTISLLTGKFKPLATCNPDEEPVLFFESLYNHYWKPITKWACVLEADLSLLDVDRVITYSNDGWYNVDNIDTKSLVVTLHKQVIVETIDIEQVELSRLVRLHY